MSMIAITPVLLLWFDTYAWSPSRATSVDLAHTTDSPPNAPCSAADPDMSRLLRRRFRATF
ncbi:hypothetical protein PF008_g19886 [Phytophthora fragariae]|uniref:RxLR effector protein n=1 Tax=Phytophthora fragariae TaxID=53985 RepID=A0A6G0R269_9STRA|nr:hypothetical protein PF008_g19886 [Phytophthora fragariae]